MLRQTATSVVLIGLTAPLAGTLDAWVRAHLAEPLDITSVQTVPDALAYLRSHRIDLVLADETAARHELRTIHAVSPETAIIAVMMKPDNTTRLQMLRHGAHEVLSLFPSADTDHVRMLQQALARVNGRADILKESAPRTAIAAAPPQLIHDLNNLLTSINGFADLLLAQLPPDHPARMGAEQIRLAGKRATSLLKTQSVTHSSTGSPSSTTVPSITAKAA